MTIVKACAGWPEGDVDTMAAVKTVFVHSVKKEYIIVVVRETNGFGYGGAAGGHAEGGRQLNVLLDALAPATPAPGAWQEGEGRQQLVDSRSSDASAGLGLAALAGEGGAPVVSIAAADTRRTRWHGQLRRHRQPEEEQWTVVPRKRRHYKAWEWAEWRRRKVAEEWDQQQAEKRREAESSKKRSEATSRIQNFARTWLAMRLVDRLRAAKETACTATRPLAQRRDRLHSAETACTARLARERDRLDAEALEAACTEVKAQLGHPELVLLERAISEHAPQCGVCHKPMVAGKVTKLTCCGHCVDRLGMGHGRISRGSRALYCGRGRCTTGMCLKCVRIGMSGDDHGNSGSGEASSAADLVLEAGATAGLLGAEGT